MATNEIKVIESFELGFTSPNEEDAKDIQDEMESLGGCVFDTIKVPAGGSTTWEIPTGNGDETETSSELDVIILKHHAVNVYYKESYTGEFQLPECSSLDGKVGVDKVGHTAKCADCPNNKYGSGAGRGKACKNTYRLYMVRSGSSIPVILNVSPASIANLNNYIQKTVIRGMGKPSYQVVTRLTLSKAKNGNGIVYSKINFQCIGILSDKQIEIVKAIRSTIADEVPDVVTEDDIARADEIVVSNDGVGTPDKDGFVDVKEGEDELPFM